MKPATLVILSIALATAPAGAGDEADNAVIAIEAEDTASPLKKWEKKTEVEGFSGAGYLEFTGNSPISGKPNSPLTYKFKVSKGGLYFLHLRCARETVDGRSDLANDCYVRLEGDFGPGPEPGDEHGDDAPLEMLEKDTKFFGGNDNEFVWASGNRLDPGGHNNKRIAVYDLKAGEEYTLTVSGRSQLFKLDRIVFRHTDVAKEDAEKLSE